MVLVRLEQGAMLIKRYREFVKFARNVARLAVTAIEKLGTRVLADTQRTH